jgi:hypothetical protein
MEISFHDFLYPDVVLLIRDSGETDTILACVGVRIFFWQKVKTKKLGTTKRYAHLILDIARQGPSLSLLISLLISPSEPDLFRASSLRVAPLGLIFKSYGNFLVPRRLSWRSSSDREIEGETAILLAPYWFEFLRKERKNETKRNETKPMIIYFWSRPKNHIISTASRRRARFLLALAACVFEAMKVDVKTFGICDDPCTPRRLDQPFDRAFNLLLLRLRSIR